MVWEVILVFEWGFIGKENVKHSTVSNSLLSKTLHISTETWHFLVAHWIPPLHPTPCQPVCSSLELTEVTKPLECLSNIKVHMAEERLHEGISRHQLCLPVQHFFLYFTPLIEPWPKTTCVFKKPSTQVTQVTLLISARRKKPLDGSNNNKIRP